MQWNSILGQEDPLEEEMTIHSSILLWRIPRTGQPGGLQSTGLHSQTQLSTNNSVHYSNKHMRACALSCFSRVQLCNPMDCSLPGSSMEFSRPKYWSGLPYPSPLPTQQSLLNSLTCLVTSKAHSQLRTKSQGITAAG